MRYKKRDLKRGSRYFTVKERTILRALLKNGRTSNVRLGKNLKITPQVTGRIRRKLARDGVIKNYQTEVDYRALGIHAFSLVLFDIEAPHENKIISPNLISFYKILTNQGTHIALYAFRSLEETNDYFDSLHAMHPEHIKIVRVHSFPLKGSIKHSSEDLFQDTIRKFGKIYSPPMKSISSNHNQRENRQISKNLSLNEKKVLRYFIKNPGISCRKISEELVDLEITRSGVNRIKQRLENRKIIKRYTVKLDYEKLGINVLAFIFISKRQEYWKISKTVEGCTRSYPNIIGCYKLNEDSMYAFLCGFKNLAELENLCSRLQAKGSDLLKIKHVYVTSPDGVLKESSDDLFLSLL